MLLLIENLANITLAELHEYVYPEYEWYPSVLANASRSAEWMTTDYYKLLTSTSRSPAATARDAEAYIRKALPEYLGVHDASNEEVTFLVQHPELAPYTFADIISRRSQTGWATHGHSAADVNIYTSDSLIAKDLKGNRENTEVGEFLARYLDVDVGAITKELREKGVDADGGYETWMGAMPVGTERLDGQTHVELGLSAGMGHYEGDFKKMLMKRHEGCEICGLS